MNQIPPPPPGLATDPRPGRTIVKSSRALLRKDKSLSFLPLIGGICSLIAASPLLAAQLLFKGQTPIQIVLAVLTIFIGTIVTTFFSVALSAGASIRMDGGDPTISSCIGAARQNLLSIVQWGIFAALIGLVIKLLEKQLKDFGGVLVRVIGDASFTLASYFVIPMLAHEKIGPIKAIKKSITTIRAQWRTALRFNLRLGLWALGMFLGAAAIAGGAFAGALSIGTRTGASSTEILLAMVIALVGFVVFMWAMLYINAVNAYGRTALYRFATGRPVPGFSAEALQGAAQVPAFPGAKN